ncbi:MAG: PFL family protein [Chloroflexota bacterium]
MARGPLGMDEILESVGMVGRDHLDIRTVTLGINLRGCRSPEEVLRRVTGTAADLVKVSDALARETGIPIVNRRVAVTPIAWVAERPDRELIIDLARALDEAADAVGVDFIGGLSALVEKQASRIDEELMAALPAALADTHRVCASVNIASTGAGINMDAVRFMGEVVKETAERTADEAGIGCAKLVVFANAVPDNPFMAGAFHGFGEGDAAISVGISGPGVVANALRRLPAGAPMQDLSEEIKRTVFKITRVGEHVGREVARRLEIPFGIVDISLAPTSLPGDSVAEILELIGVERVGLPGTTVALAMLNDAVKKGGAMATSRAGGLSGAFIPVSEDANFASAVADGHLVLEKMEAMTAVCSVGLDMIALPGDTSAQTISAIIADEAAIGIVNSKTTACRLVPVPGAQPGEWVDWGGLLGRAPVMSVRDRATVGLVQRAGHVPPTLRALGN